ncbi:MAG: methyltransferase domain-containing protein [Rhodobacter sp.]|nr:methyltransferase domain-containing protein [Rhodobacter sp.]
MPRPPELTDRMALLRNRARAAASKEPALFLQEEAALELQERLIQVNRRFTSAAIVTGWPEVWRGRVPGARVVADDEVLALEPGAHDLVIHALALHWAADPVGQLIQARRALQPDGLFLGALFGGQTLAELRAVLAEAEAAVAGGLSPRVAPMGEIRDLGALLQRAGFALPVADSLTRTVSYTDAWHLMRDLRAMGETNALAARPRRFARRALFETAAKRYADAFAGPDGRVSATFEIICLTGWAPGAGQPEPLRPGSARARLADVLGVEETPLPDTTLPHRD